MGVLMGCEKMRPLFFDLDLSALAILKSISLIYLTPLQVQTSGCRIVSLCSRHTRRSFGPSSSPYYPHLRRSLKTTPTTVTPKHGKIYPPMRGKRGRAHTHTHTHTQTHTRTHQHMSHEMHELRRGREQLPGNA